MRGLWVCELQLSGLWGWARLSNLVAMTMGSGPVVRGFLLPHEWCGHFGMVEPCPRSPWNEGSGSE